GHDEPITTVLSHRADTAVAESRGRTAPGWWEYRSGAGINSFRCRCFHHPGTINESHAAGPGPLHRVGRPQVPRQEPVRLGPRLPRELRVQAVELVTPGRVLVDLVLERLAGRLQRLDEVLDLQHVDVLVVGRRVDQDRRLKLLGVPRRRPA